MSCPRFHRLAICLCLAVLSVPLSGQASAQQGSFRYPRPQQASPVLTQAIPVATPLAAPMQAQQPVASGQPSSVVQAGAGGQMQRAQPIPSRGQAVGSGVVPAGLTQVQAAMPAGRQRGAAPSRMMQRGNAMQPMGRGPVAQASYVPRHMRMAQMVGDVPLNGAAAMPQALPAVDPGMMASDAMVGESYVDEGDWSGADPCCADSCGDVCGPSCCDRGGCPPGIIDECWLGGLGELLYRAEYFAGAACWDSPTFQDSRTSTYNGGSGFYAGTNLGIPLCRLTCGLFSGQIGARGMQSEFNGSPNVSQLFATGGFYRRVDYGVQFGCVLDYLREDSLFEAELMQIRGDLSWVYAGGDALGFRFAKGIQDDQVPEVIPGANQQQFRLQVLDNYRAYYRHLVCTGGYSDTFIGWTDDNHVVGGMEFDLPMTECVALQAGATWFLPTSNPDNVLGGNAEDGWNIAVGFAFRPQGRCWYENYDRPILPVADNGSMMLRRGF